MTMFTVDSLLCAADRIRHSWNVLDKMTYIAKKNKTIKNIKNLSRKVSHDSIVDMHLDKFKRRRLLSTTLMIVERVNKSMCLLFLMRRISTFILPVH
jgi:hypothetical protein